MSANSAFDGHRDRTDLEVNAGLRGAPRCVTERIFRVGLSGAFHWREVAATKLSYHRSGNRDQLLRFVQGELMERLVFAYDAHGVRTGPALYRANGGLVHQWRFIYDEQGHRVKQVQLDAQGRERGWVAFDHDTAGRRIRQTAYDTDGRMRYCYVMTYDAAGNKTRVVIYRGARRLHATIRTRYDTAHEKVRDVIVERGGHGCSVTTYRYLAWDDVGNWTLRLDRQFSTRRWVLPAYRIVVVQRQMAYYEPAVAHVGI